jgi:hypothetical protein
MAEIRSVSSFRRATGRKLETLSIENACTGGMQMRHGPCRCGTHHAAHIRSPTVAAGYLNSYTETGNSYFTGLTEESTSESLLT